MLSIKEICLYLEQKGESSSYVGNEMFQIEGFCSLQAQRDGCITWAKSIKKLEDISLEKREKMVIVTEPPGIEIFQAGNYIFTNEPKKVFFSILDHFYKKKERAEIGEDSTILTKRIGKNVSIGHGCYISESVVIGDNVTIGNHVSIECPTVIGAKSLIHSGVVIGTDGFGYYKDGAEYGKVPHFGGVYIGEKVEIGANTCIDRGTLDDTRIEDNVKIDNLCHIAHNVRIGKNSLIIACSLLGGSSEIQENGYVAPGAIVKNQVTVGNDSVVGMGSVVTRDIEPGKIVAGVPAKIIRDNDGKL